MHGPFHRFVEILPLTRIVLSFGGKVDASFVLAKLRQQRGLSDAAASVDYDQLGAIQFVGRLQRTKFFVSTDECIHTWIPKNLLSRKLLFLKIVILLIAF